MGERTRYRIQSAMGFLLATGNRSATSLEVPPRRNSHAVRLNHGVHVSGRVPVRPSREGPLRKNSLAVRLNHGVLVSDW